MEGIDGTDYIVYVPARWNIPRDGGSFVGTHNVWNIEACVTWGDGDDSMQGTFGECWMSKEWKKSSSASFWLIDWKNEWAFFTQVKNDYLPMSGKEYVSWTILGHLLRVIKLSKMLLQGQ